MNTQLGQERARVCADYLAAVYPRWKTTPEMLLAIRNSMARISIDEEQARVIIDDSLTYSKGGSPDLSGIYAKMRAAAQQVSIKVETQVRKAETFAPFDAPVFREFCHRERETGSPFYVNGSAWRRQMMDMAADIWESELRRKAGRDDWREPIERAKRVAASVPPLDGKGPNKLGDIVMHVVAKV